MLLLSTLVISPAAFVANAAEQYGITINHIFSDGYNADSSYDELYGTYEVGTTPLVTIDAPYGYIIDEVYFTTPSGEDFSLFVEDLQYDNPVHGVYHITMPDYALEINVIYRCILNSVVINHIYDGGHNDDADYQVVLNQEQMEGSTVNFAADVKEGYAIDTMYVLGYAGTAFSTLLDLPIENLGGSNYVTQMPDQPITINIVYVSNRHEISVAAMFDDVVEDGAAYYDGPLTADPGETVVFAGLPVDDYGTPEVYVTAGAGQDFVEVVELQQVAGAYYFVMPDAEVIVHLIYSNARFGITANNIFEDGTEDDTAYYSGADSAVVGERVVFTVDVPQGYGISEIYGSYAAGSAFVEMFPIDSLAGTYYFDMPEGDVVITIVYTATLFDVNFTSYKEDDLDSEWTVADVAAGSTFVFGVNAPEGFVVDEVFAMANISDTFVEIIPVDDLGNGSYSIEMPEADVDVVIIYKTSLFNVNFASYDGTELVDEWQEVGVAAGDKYIFTIDVPDGYAIDEVVATTAVNDLFVEVLNVTNLGGAFYFTMPEADVDVSVIYRKSTFEYTVNDLVDDAVVNTSAAIAKNAGETVIIVAAAPAGYNGYSVESVTAVSASDPSVEYALENISGDVYTFEMPEDDVIVNIEWKAYNHTVTVTNVDENGAVISTDTINDVTDGTTVSIPLALNVSGASEYELVEYFAVVEVAPFHELIDVAVSGDSLTFTMPAGDVDVTVVWAKSAYTVTERYIVNETEVLDELTTVWDVHAGDNWISVLTLPEGYQLSEIFVTAMDGAFGEPVDYIELNETTILFEIPAGNVFVDHYLEPAVSTVNYYAYVDGAFALVNTEEVAYGEKAAWGKENAAADLPDGHAFTGWYLGAEAYDFEAEVKGDIDLYAVYEFITYTVSFNSDGGSEVASQTVIKNGKAVEPAAPEKEGFDFAGWQLAGAAYDFDTEVTADIELTATWTEQTFTVTLPTSDDYEVKTADGSSTTVPYGGSYSFTVDYADGVDGENAVVTANGETLTPNADGVYTVENITSDVYISVGVQGTQEPVIYTVKFNYYHGDEAISVTNKVEEGGSVTAPEDTARYTYRFLGWFDNAEGTGEAVTDFTNITADAEYFAVYEQNPLADYTFGEYTVTDSAYGIGFKEVKIEVVKNNAEYQDRDVYVIAAAQLKDGSTVLFYVPVYVENGEVKADVSLILNSNTFEYVDMYIVYDEVDLSGSLNWIDIESGIQVA